MKTRIETFNTYSKNLELVFQHLLPDQIDQVKGKYACPICLRLFGVEHLEHLTTNHLTVEHVPPQSVGGKKKILTCRDCNNIQGSKIDSFLPSALKAKSFFQGTLIEGWEGEFLMNNSFVTRGKLIFSNEGFTFQIDPKRSNIKDLNDSLSIFGTGKPFTLKSTLKIKKPRKANLSVIRAAYLTGFAKLGYGFLANQNIDLIRQQILKPHETIFDSNIVLEGSNAPEEGIFLISNKTDEKFYAIVFNLNIKGLEIFRTTVLLPGGHRNGFQAINNFLSGGILFFEKVFSLNNEEILLEENFCIRPVKYWNLLDTKSSK